MNHAALSKREKEPLNEKKSERDLMDVARIPQSWSEKYFERNC